MFKTIAKFFAAAGMMAVGGCVTGNDYRPSAVTNEDAYGNTHRSQITGQRTDCYEVTKQRGTTYQGTTVYNPGPAEMICKSGPDRESRTQNPLIHVDRGLNTVNRGLGTVNRMQRIFRLNGDPGATAAEDKEFYQDIDTQVRAASDNRLKPGIGM